MQTPLLSSKWWLPAMVSGLLFVSCSHKLAPEGHYQSTPVIADGKTDDWQIPLRFSNSKYTFQYNVTNDDGNLYICVSSRETATQLRILRSGMTIWFDPKGEKNKTVGLYFPLRREPEPERYRGNGSDLNTREAELLLQSNYYNTTGFPGIENGQFGVTDTKGPVQLAIKHDDQDTVLVYELRIPIQNVLGANWKAKAAKKNFSVGIVLNSTPGMRAGGGRPNGGGMRGMSGGMGGMRVPLGGGGRRYGGGGGSQGQQEEADWYVFRLALK
ncbi:MAG TPA: hypothetical protein VL727_14400 [Puia sp.]|nr:hypothetical protein [Puia sp.]